MHGTDYIPGKVSLTMLAGTDPLRPVFIDNTYIAVAQWASVSTGVTFNASIKFFLPEIPAFRKVLFFHFRHIFKEVSIDGRLFFLSDQNIIKRWRAHITIAAYRFADTVTA
jgi:hypothetical protein